MKKMQIQAQFMIANYQSNNIKEINKNFRKGKK